MKKAQHFPGPRWRFFLEEAFKRLSAAGVTVIAERVTEGVSVVEQIAREIVRGGEGPAFLKSVRRGRPTSRQNLRYQMLREVERAIGDTVKRRRPANNIPDSLALKPQQSPDADQREFGL